MTDPLRVFVEKKHGYSVVPKNILEELKTLFVLPALQAVRLVTFYEIFGLPPRNGIKYAEEILSEPPADIFSTEFESVDGIYIVSEYLPGQFDQRADSAAACFSLILDNNDIQVKSGRILDLAGTLTDTEYERIKKYWINPIEMREKKLDDTPLLNSDTAPEQPVPLTGFTDASVHSLKRFTSQYNLAMSMDDLVFTQKYFISEKRDPYLSELRVIDTYWSDHCRHTTFETEIIDIDFPSTGITEPISEAWKLYTGARAEAGRDSSPVTLMDIATIWAKDMLARGKLEDLEVSEEINAASIRITADTSSGEIDWLMMFKNETHNHPTELEPFGGAATCIGGAIRDPLSGRAFVYQGARVTGSADPRAEAARTMKGKLPQHYITTRAAAGYSSYGNQIGLATSFVREFYDSGFAAKRMEVGAVIGGTPADHVVQKTPEAGDAVLVIGGATGRDGCGGATGSSRSHNKRSISTAGSEVQKGNAPEERKLQRFFRNRETAVKIKKCNDFGAGGACVAIGELSRGVKIVLDTLPVKYQGLTGTELAISESQERMAVVVSEKDRQRVIDLAAMENLDAVRAAEITDNDRLIMEFHGEKIVDIARDFLDTNGVKRMTKARINTIERENNPFTPVCKGSGFTGKLKNRFNELDIADRKGLIGMFDSTVGAGTVLMPLGGMYQETEAEASVHLLPLEGTRTASVLAAGYNPVLSRWSPFHGAVYAAVECLCRITASGGRWNSARFSFQEYFPSPGNDPGLWGLPLASLLGGIWIQAAFDLPAIGGKDSMSGTFENLTVPPTLVAFAVTTADAQRVISPEFKVQGNSIYLFHVPIDSNFLPDIVVLKDVLNAVEREIGKGRIISAWSLREGGLAEGLVKMSFGNRLGAEVDISGTAPDPFSLSYGSIIVESAAALDYPYAVKLGTVTGEWKLDIQDKKTRETVLLDEIYSIFKKPLSKVFTQEISPAGTAGVSAYYGTAGISKKKGTSLSVASNAKPAVTIPVFPGTNCEDESSLAFKREGAEVTTFIFRNRTAADTHESILMLARTIQNSQILFLPGGFSAGDEPDGSGKFIVSVLKTPPVREAVTRLLGRGGLILGICNGFQALLKSGLLPFGRIGAVDESSPTLIGNTIGHHISTIAPTRYTGVSSPWLDDFYEGEVHDLPFSHGEGRFKAPKEVLDKLFADRQVAFQYSDREGSPLTDSSSINGSDGGVEGLVSPDGRILGKMGHSERYRDMLYRNYPGFRPQNIFASGVRYFS